MGSQAAVRALCVALTFSAVSGWLVGVPVRSEPAADAAASSTRAAGPVEDAGPAPAVGLDALLKLPAKAPPPTLSKRNGGGPNEWRTRFAAAREALASAEAGLAGAQAKLEELASGGGSWQVTAPGAEAGSDTGPLSFGLRQEIRRQREAVEHAQHELDELRIEANLAGVPEEWMGEAPPAR